MKRYIILAAFAFFILAGAGCKQNSPGLNLDKMREALVETGNELGWSEYVIEKPPSEENNFGKSFILYGPVKQESIETVLSNNIEIIEFDNGEYATRAYGKEECFKGRGEPMDIYEIEGCCLNDGKNGTSRAVMKAGKYIFRAADYFHAGCKAGEHLKKFWGDYLKK